MFNHLNNLTNYKYAFSNGHTSRHNESNNYIAVDISNNTVSFQHAQCVRCFNYNSSVCSGMIYVEASSHWNSRVVITQTLSSVAANSDRKFGVTVYPKKYAHGFVVLCFVVVMQSFIMNSHEVFIHIHQGCFAGTGAIVRLPQCQWSKPDGYGKISQCITTTKHSKAKTVCIFLGIYCMTNLVLQCTGPTLMPE